MNGITTELKTITGNSLNTPVTRIREAFQQGASQGIIDARVTKSTNSQANESLSRAGGSFCGELPGWAEIWPADGMGWR